MCARGNLHQGFKVYIDDLCGSISKGKHITLMLGGTEVFLRQYVDAVLLIAPTIAKLQISLVRLQAYSFDNQMVVNKAKSFVMEVRGQKKRSRH